MKALFRHALALLMAVSAVEGTYALDLPVKRVNGIDQYYYAVRRGDTVYSLARRLGISRDEIVEYNPSAADGLRQGSTLYFPVSVFGAPEDKALAAPSQATPTFRYKVQRGETLFGLSHRFGVTPEAIVALNPQSNDGIKAGEYLLIPVTGETAGHAAATGAREECETPKGGNSVAPVAAAGADVADSEAGKSVASAPVATPASPDVPDNRDTEAETIGSAPAQIEGEVEMQTLTGMVAVLLPLMLDEENAPKSAHRASDFVKGLMIAASEMSDDGSPIKIKVFDTKGSAAEIARIMADSTVSDADVIVTPEDESSLRAVLGKASPEAYVFNILAVQDTAYLTHDNVLQANIPHEMMYETAVRGLMENFEGYTPVFLVSKGGRSEKLAFTDYARAKYAERGIVPLEIAFEGILQQSDLDLLGAGNKYVFIPCSGSLSEFNKFARTLRTARENSANPESIALFGYPDWTIFRGDAAELLHSLEATFYSRFFANPNSSETAAFNTAFTRQFGSEPMAVVPSQALLGYDTARFLITNLRNNSGVFSPENPTEFTGLQSTFRFVMPEPLEENHPDPDGQERGAVNTALYLITYLSGNGVASRVL